MQFQKMLVYQWKLSRAYDHTESADYILEMTKHDYTGFDQMESKHDVVEAYWTIQLTLIVGV